MDRFVSTFTNKIDAKGRVSIPASFRAVLELNDVARPIRKALAEKLAHTKSAPLEVIEVREEVRGHGRHLGNARGHFGHGMDADFDLVVDAGATGPDERAECIMQFVRAEGFLERG